MKANSAKNISQWCHIASADTLQVLKITKLSVLYIEINSSLQMNIHFNNPRENANIHNYTYTGH